MYNAAQPQLVFRHVISVPVLQLSANSSIFTLPWLPPLPACYPCASLLSVLLSSFLAGFLSSISIIFQLCSTFTCQLFHYLGRFHIYLPTSAPPIQAVATLVAHHLILPAPAMSSLSFLRCCFPLVLGFLSLTLQLIPGASVVLVWSQPHQPFLFQAVLLCRLVVRRFHVQACATSLCLLLSRWFRLLLFLLPITFSSLRCLLLPCPLHPLFQSRNFRSLLC